MGGYIPKILKTNPIYPPSPDMLNIIEVFEAWMQHTDNHTHIVGRLNYRKFKEILEGNERHLEARFVTMKEVTPRHAKTKDDAKTYFRLINKAHGNHFIFTT